MADIYYSLTKAYKQASGITDIALGQLTLSECYIFGKSTSNQRIKAIWW